ncbi:hypothetical protein KIW84_035331 [Lathyrus oleraceus]|uniref:Uncharacterized protein n=1 Tax=Pisum sativum TaxID=3888 RepID=A0A9D5B6J3_PEA|nr:hypothetical protein KIW84_035331 [Pisum sativum]
MANQPNNPNESIPASNPTPSTGGSVGPVPVSEAMPSSTGSVPAVSISQNAPSSSVRAQQMSVGTPHPVGNTSRPFVTNFTMPPPGREQSFGMPTSGDQAEVGEDWHRKEYQRLAYPKEEENLIEFIKRCQKMRTEVMLCPRCSAIFDRKAATNLEAVDKAKRKENWGTTRYDPRRRCGSRRWVRGFLWKMIRSSFEGFGSVFVMTVLAVVSLFSLALALQCLVLLREMFAFEKTNKMEEIIEWHLREQDEVRNDDHQHYSFEKEQKNHAVVSAPHFASGDSYSKRIGTISLHSCAGLR